MLTLREGFDYRFSALDPRSAHVDPPAVAVYETLLAKGPDGSALPCLASVEDVSADGLEWTLRLRAGARFHSGDDCDAAAVVESLEVLRWQAGSQRQLWYWDPVDTVAPVGADRIAFTLAYPYPKLPSLLWGTHTAIFNVARQGDDPRAGTEIADGTGPYRLISYSPVEVVAERNPHYDGPTPCVHGGRIDRISWQSILDPLARSTALQSGELDIVHGPDLASLAELEATEGLHVWEAPQPSCLYLSLNWHREDLMFHDVRMRRALSLAIDRGALVDQVLAGHGSPLGGPLPPSFPHHDANLDQQGRVDPHETRRLLDELGWRDDGSDLRCRGGVPLSFECVVQDDPVFLGVARLVARALSEVGVGLTVRAVAPFEPFYSAMRDQPASSISKWLWPDPLDALIGFSRSDTAPFPNWSNASVPDLDAAFDQWLRADGDEQTRDVAHRVQRIFADQLPYVTLLNPHDIWAWSDGVRDFVPSAQILYPYYQMVSVVSPPTQ